DRVRSGRSDRALRAGDRVHHHGTAQVGSVNRLSSTVNREDFSFSASRLTLHESAHATIRDPFLLLADLLGDRLVRSAAVGALQVRLPADFRGAGSKGAQDS